MPRSKRHYRITVDEAIDVHERALSETGGRPGIQDIGLVEAAVGRPYSGYYLPIHKKAAALIQSVAVNHGFIDGNKRTALILFHLLLGKSGYAFQQTSTLHDEDDVEHLILDLTNRFLDLSEVEAWLKKRIVRQE